MITANGFRAGFLGLALFFGLNLFGTATAFAGPYGECPGPVSTTTEKWEHAEGSSFKWDPDNPQTIDRDGSAGISVIGGVAPYTWSVSGTGFILSLDQTEEKTNSLYAGSNACGTAEITVKDGFGHTVKGYVRSDNGQWVWISTTCKIPGNYDGDEVGGWVYRIEGKYKQRQKYLGVWFGSYGSCGSGGKFRCSECDGRCSDNTECITYDCNWCWGATTTRIGDNPDCICCGGTECVDGTWREICCAQNVGIQLFEWRCPQ